MKKTLLAALLALPCLAQAQTPAPFSYTIKGKLGSLNAPAKLYLVRGMQIADSATLKNGAFEMRGTADAPVTADLVFRRKGRLTTLFGPMGDRARIFLEPGTLAITSPDSLAHATFKGGLAMADYLRLTAAVQPVMDRMKAAGAENRKATEAERNDPAFRERMQAQFEGFSKEMTQGYYKFIKANPNSWASLDALLGLRSMEVPQYATVGPLYEALSPALKNSPQGHEYGEIVQGLKETAVGQPAPAFSQKTPDGKTVSLADYRGKYVLVDFWASWCGPCRAENPNVTKVYNEFKGRNFDILGVSLDDEKGRAKWLKAVEDDHLAWTQVSDLKGWQNEAAQRYHVRAIPQNFLVDPTGKIVAANLRGEELKTTLAKLIK
ncbi:TlpA disulfide reductase family protein [Hymenobacter properus]|uniref:AhpC/TSA family protein n=1 Tax=Hymenobacter properus TaxID=2791026 RepID=A0A931BLN6_9BACT|nr:TlpA disulfide reductase family protein [Hymenobacter properus]MBF9143662.1 AhpC/TSA family protein [Hymenobacter properus]MBR7722475.1 AhpC/TSA family protein [Microvirga sp. SRT04]